MKRKIIWLAFSFIIVSAMLFASCSSSNSSSTSNMSGTSNTTTSGTSNNQAGTILTVTFGSTTNTYTMANMQALLNALGYGGAKTQSGTITGPYLYQGPALTTIIDKIEPDGITPGQSVKATGSDGYSVTFTYDQITNGSFITYDPKGNVTTPPASSATVPVIAVNYWANGNILASGIGPLELGIVYGQQLLTDSSYWVKMVNKIEIIPAS